ncbi:MAG: hypothetical protein M3Y66_03325 [Actinomycetota bacterium]|nr:hypothetical protein [Actinomycetota bacterium]
MATTSTTRFVTSADGTEIAYDRRGRGESGSGSPPYAVQGEASAASLEPALRRRAHAAK